MAQCDPLYARKTVKWREEQIRKLRGAEGKTMAEQEVDVVARALTLNLALSKEHARIHARLAIEALDTHREQQGWKLVPVEPIEEQVYAGRDAVRGKELVSVQDAYDISKDIYRAMIEASPKAGK